MIFSNKNYINFKMTQFQNAMNTCNDMLNDRGFIESGIIEEQYKIYEKDTNKTMLIISQSDKLNIDYMKEYIKLLSDNEIKSCIIVYNNDITPSAKKVVENLFQYSIELFTLNELQFNITKHRLYNKHEKLNQEERREFVEKYGIKIPVILEKDPVSRYFNFKKGNVIRVTRKNDIIVYRIVK